MRIQITKVPDNLITVEKQEKILGDFDQDGQQELMGVNTGSHSSGNDQTVKIPPSSFVYSDTKALKIKDPDILAQFGMAPKKGGYTPAYIAKKYDLNKFKKITDDPNADDMSKKTAQMMSDNYLQKLQKLAAYQESLKNPQQQPSIPGQQQGQNFVQTDGNMGQGDQTPMQQYGGPQFDNTDPNNNQIPYVNSFYYGVPNPPYHGNKSATWNSDMINRRGESYGWDHKEPLGEYMTSNYPDVVANQNAIYGNPNDMTPQDRLGVNYGPRHQLPPYPMSQAPTLDPHQLPIPQDQQTPQQIEQNLAASSIPGQDKKLKGNTQTTGNNNFKGFGVNPNFLGDALNLEQMAQVRRFQPFEPVPQAVIPQTVFADPTRAIAAQQELANTATQNANMSGDARAARSTALAYQGEAAKGIADTIGQYANSNTQIANQANQNAAGITNELMAKQANRLAELNKANFLSDRDYQREMGKLQSEYVGRMQEHHDQDVKTTWLNKTSPYFDIDPVTQMPIFKSAEAQAAFQKATSGNTQMSSNDFKGKVAQAKSYKDELVRQGYSPDIADRMSLKYVGLGESESLKEDAQGKVLNKTVRGVNPNQQKYGGQVPKYGVGGDFLQVPSSPIADFIPMAGGSNPYDNMPQGLLQVPQGVSQNAQRPTYQAQDQSQENYQDTPKRNSKLSIAVSTNNPGNMIYNSRLAKYGAVDSGIKQKDGSGTFASFPDINTGFQAMQTQLFGATDGIMQSKYYNKNTPVGQALNKWSNGGYGAEIYPEIAGKTLGQLTPQERDELTKRQVKREDGSMYKLLKQRGVFQDGGFALSKFIR